MGYNAELAAIYENLTRAETGAYADPYIRTWVRPEGGSTAFGPAQIIRTKIVDYANRGLLSPHSEKFAREVILPMQEKFSYYGGPVVGYGKKKLGYDRAYDYGGTGNFDKKYIPQYIRLAQEMLGHDYKKSKGDIMQMLRSWVGGDPSEDYLKRYFQK